MLRAIMMPLEARGADWRPLEAREPPVPAARAGPQLAWSCPHGCPPVSKMDLRRWRRSGLARRLAGADHVAQPAEGSAEPLRWWRPSFEGGHWIEVANTFDLRDDLIDEGDRASPMSSKLAGRTPHSRPIRYRSSPTLRPFPPAPALGLP